jgi:DNA polymerase IIIc chi subunit
MEVNFYQTDDIIHKAMAPLLQKILEDKKKVLIYSKNSDLLKQIDDGLWSFSKTKFLPHSTKFEKSDPLKNPIFLTDDEANENKAEFLIMLDKADDDFAKKFTKIFHFFDNNNLSEAKKLWIYYKQKSANLNFYKKLDGKWSKMEI